MFLQIIDLIPYIYINKKILDIPSGFEFVITSKFTNRSFPEGAAPIPAYWLQTNDRYTQYQLELPEFWFNNPEANGIFSYQLRSIEFGSIIDQGLIKVISAAPENNTYISNNDDREAVVYFEN